MLFSFPATSKSTDICPMKVRSFLLIGVSEVPLCDPTENIQISSTAPLKRKYLQTNQQQTVAQLAKHFLDAQDLSITFVLTFSCKRFRISTGVSGQSRGDEGRQAREQVQVVWNSCKNNLLTHHIRNRQTFVLLYIFTMTTP